MRYSILILVLSISVGLYAKEWEQDSTAIISEEKITTLNNTTYTNITIKGTWTDNFGHYGIYKCNANSVKNSETVKLEGICEGENEHHKIEAIFKAFAKALKFAIKRDISKMILPTTKGKL